MTQDLSVGPGDITVGGAYSPDETSLFRPLMLTARR